ncbi:PDZ domain-containing protein [Sphingobacteriales bacterium UPWRP_1]|nr:hypothetical protein B6N25_13090 [Sphingobacteriales bacterium TSM_CSS]PSJ73286.1 PDZ domain-containing protein [Sphingobacteriales bacterium UPWRP_1]
MFTKINSFFIIFCILNLLTLSAKATPGLSYKITMPQPHTHYFNVEMTLAGWSKDTAEIKMAVWTPGSYLIREFSRKVEGFTATDAKGNALPCLKTQKNTWQITNCPKDGNIIIQYMVYSFELSVRTSFLDSDMGFISPSSVLMYADGWQNIPATLQIVPYAGWKQLSTALKPVNPADKWLLQVPDFDTLADSPILIGNHEVITFEAAGIPHHLAVAGPGNHNLQQMAADIPKIVTAETKIFGEHPCTEYTFIQINTQNMGGGLEHLHSTALMNPRWDFMPQSNYVNWLGLVAHEYFHLWNVKRVRPVELGPFNYENENYTRMLWVAEGFTSYYDDYILQRTGFHTAQNYLNIVAGNLAGVDSRPGSAVQSLAESSLDAWIKYYRSDENSDNATVTYYNGGAVVATMLDLGIRHATGGKKSLDDVMRYLYNEYYKKLQRGYTEAEFSAAINLVAGTGFDEFINDHVYNTKPIDYKRYLGYAGLTLKNTAATNNDPNLGISASSGTNGFIISKVKRGSCGYNSGLNVNDEILSVNNYRVKNETELKTILSQYNNGNTVQIMVNRSGIIKTIPVTLQPLPGFSYSIEKLPKATNAQKELYKGWLGEDF